MTTPNGMERVIAELEALEKQTTPGRWIRFMLAIQADDARRTIVAEGTGTLSNPTAVADVDFVCAARNALPTLLALARWALQARDVLSMSVHNLGAEQEQGEDLLRSFSSLAASTEGK